MLQALETGLNISSDFTKWTKITDMLSSPEELIELGECKAKYQVFILIRQKYFTATDSQLESGTMHLTAALWIIKDVTDIRIIFRQKKSRAVF